MVRKIFDTAVLFLLFLAIFLLGARCRTAVIYNDAAFEGEAVLYHASESRPFDGGHSVYTYAYGKKAVFDIKKGYDRICIVPDTDGKATVASVHFMINSLPVYTVSGDKLNNEEYFTKNDDIVSEQNALVFSPSLNKKIALVQKAAILLCFVFSLLCTAAVFLVKPTARFVFGKTPRAKAFISGNQKQIVFNIILFLFLLVSMRYFNNYSFVLEQGASSTGRAVIYYDCDNNGFKETNSAYTDVSSGMGKFYTVSNTEGLRLAANGKISIKAVHIIRDGIPTHSYTADELKNKYLSNGDEIMLKNGEITLSGSKVLEFNKRFLNELNRPSPLAEAADILKAALFFVFASVGYVLYLKGKNAKLRYLHKLKGGFAAVALMAAGITILCMLIGIKPLAYAVMIPLIFFVIYALGAFNKLKTSTRSVYAPFCSVLAAIFLFNTNSGLFAPQDHFIFAFWCCILTALSLLCYICAMQFYSGRNDKNTEPHAENIAGFFTKAAVTVFIYEYVKIGLQMGYHSIPYILGMMLGDVIQLNLMLILVFLCTIYGLLGRRWADTLYFVCCGILLLGNAIKLNYHNTMLTPADFLQFKDGLAIAPTILGETVYHAVIAVLVIIAAVFVLNIKKILASIKPKPFWKCFFISLIIMTLFCIDISREKYKDINVYDKPFADEITNERTNGVAIYNMFKIRHLTDMAIKAPDDYNEQTAEKLLNEFDAIGQTTDDVRPNVICILAESFMDLNSVKELELNADTIPKTREHGFVTMISPRYGGYTAAVEYEVLTGLSLAFYPTSVTPYTTYYNDENRVIPSVSQTFADNGYKTYAIHPNIPNFYNRIKAYKMMGFQQYWSIGDFEGAKKVNNGFTADSAVAEKIIKTIEENDDPVFTFGITLESHATSDKRFDDPLFDTAAEMSGKAKEDLIQQAAAFSDVDEMIAGLCEYIGNCDEPTMLYVFGDHLPPLAAFSNVSYLNDINNKYSTVALCHCNYKDIKLKDRATPNYIAAQMIVDSGVPHSSYFDYIYDLKDRLPLLHRDFTEIKTDENEDLKKYYMIQYDLMFGKQYFYEKKHG